MGICSGGASSTLLLQLRTYLPTIPCASSLLLRSSSIFPARAQHRGILHAACLCYIQLRGVRGKLGSGLASCAGGAGPCSPTTPSNRLSTAVRRVRTWGLPHGASRQLRLSQLCPAFLALTSRWSPGLAGALQCCNSGSGCSKAGTVRTGRHGLM